MTKQKTKSRGAESWQSRNLRHGELKVDKSEDRNHGELKVDREDDICHSKLKVGRAQDRSHGGQSDQNLMDSLDISHVLKHVVTRV